MRTTQLLQIVLVGAILAVGGRTATAQSDPDPQQIAQTCIERVTAIAESRVERNRTIAERCVEEVTTLVEDGDIEAATRLARKCIGKVRRGSHHTAHRIQARCRMCVHVLLALGAPELAERVADICGEAKQAVRDSRAAAIEAIRGALPDES